MVEQSRRTGRTHHHPRRVLPALPDTAQLEDAAAMFRALGDAARLRLLVRLATSEICVSELAQLEDEGITTISGRLKALHAARLVKRRRDAKHVFYALSDGHVLQMVQGAVDHAAEQS